MQRCLFLKIHSTCQKIGVLQFIWCPWNQKHIWGLNEMANIDRHVQMPLERKCAYFYQHLTNYFAWCHWQEVHIASNSGLVSASHSLGQCSHGPLMLLCHAGSRRSGKVVGYLSYFVEENWPCLDKPGWGDAAKTIRLSGKKWIPGARPTKHISIEFDENSKHSSVKHTWPITTIFCTRHDSVTVIGQVYSKL